jgi:hypothetical protein
VDTGFPPARSLVAAEFFSLDASAGEGRSDKIMLKQQAKAKFRRLTLAAAKEYRSAGRGNPLEDRRENEIAHT